MILCRDPQCAAKGGDFVPCVTSPIPHKLCRAALLGVTLAHRWRNFPAPTCACGDDLAEWGNLPYPEAHARHLAAVLANTEAVPSE